MNVEKIAMQRCSELLVLANKMWKKDEVLSKRYVQLARKIAMRHRLKLGRRTFCKTCNAIFIFGENVTSRTSKKENAVLWKCNCGNVLKFSIKPK